MSLQDTLNCLWLEVGPGDCDGGCRGWGVDFDCGGNPIKCRYCEGTGYEDCKERNKFTKIIHRFIQKHSKTTRQWSNLDEER